MKISALLTHTGRALLGAACVSLGLLLFCYREGEHLAATLLVLSGTLLLFVANPNSVPGANRALRFGSKIKTVSLPDNELSQIRYDVRHAPRPGRHP